MWANPYVGSIFSVDVSVRYQIQGFVCWIDMTPSPLCLMTKRQVIDSFLLARRYQLGRQLSLSFAEFMSHAAQAWYMDEPLSVHTNELIECIVNSELKECHVSCVATCRTPCRRVSVLPLHLDNTGSSRWTFIGFERLLRHARHSFRPGSFIDNTGGRGGGIAGTGPRPQSDQLQGTLWL